MLLSEISLARSRGAVGSVHQLMINLGVLSSGILGYAFVRDLDNGWRYVQAFIAAPAAAQVGIGAQSGSRRRGAAWSRVWNPQGCNSGEVPT